VLSDISENVQLFNLLPSSELAGRDASILNNQRLHVPFIKTLEMSVSANGAEISNYPNPFKNSTTFSYELPEAGKVELVICNPMGQVIEILVNEYQQAGANSFRFDNTKLQPGAYLSRLIFTGSNSSALKTNMLILTQ
jgi:hypothetical protein